MNPALDCTRILRGYENDASRKRTVAVSTGRARETKFKNPIVCVNFVAPKLNNHRCFRHN